jgi:hypothetical protein
MISPHATCLPPRTPSATSHRINAQSSTEITRPICLGGLVSTVAMASFSSVVGMRQRNSVFRSSMMASAR